MTAAPPMGAFARARRRVAFLRYDAATAQRCLVVLNFSDEAQTAIFDLGAKQPRLLFPSIAHDAAPLTLDWPTLAPFEIFIAELG